jgi:hypothetical protein
MSQPAFLSCLAALVVLLLAGCTKQIEAPTDTGVCWHAVPLQNGQVRFNKLADNQPSIESCAASLEGMRLRFLSLGGGSEDMIGAYQGNFIFLQKEGVFISQSLTGGRYFLLGRTADGRLATAAALSTGQ